MPTTRASGSGSNERQAKQHRRYFQPSWIADYGVVPFGDGYKCLVCNAERKNLQVHGISQHANLHEESANAAEKKIKYLQLYDLYVMNNPNETVAQYAEVMRAAQRMARNRIANEIALSLAQRGRPFREGPFLKHILIPVFLIMAPDRVDEVKKLALSRQTMQRRVVAIADDFKSQLKAHMRNFLHWSIALDESTDISGTPQMSVFVRGVTPGFGIIEELLGMLPLNTGTQGADI